VAPTLLHNSRGASGLRVAASFILCPFEENF
jgi:hypothetical protein